VRTQLAGGRDLYTLHAEALALLEPGLILTQDLCRVSALPSGHVEDARGYPDCRADVLSLDPHSLDDVLASILAVGQRTAVSERATRLVGELRARLTRIAASVAGRPRPKVAVAEWVDPPFTGGHWVPDLVSAAGGEPVAAEPGARSVQASWSAIAAAAPDYVVVAPCGYHLPAAIEQAQPVSQALPATGVGDRCRRDRGTPGPPPYRRRRGHRLDTASGRGAFRAARCAPGQFSKLTDGMWVLARPDGFRLPAWHPRRQSL
jgi:iron complex transport system substrate-binding protein